jgi:ATP-binding protein involved in chromosome partitioning
MVEEQENPCERGFAFGTFEEVFRRSPHECTCHACNAPLVLDCYNCGENCWKLNLFGRHLQLECSNCGECLCLDTEVTSIDILKYLLSKESEVDTYSGERMTKTISETISEEEVRQALAKVKHPEIEHTLVDLGMIKDVTVTESRVTLTLALPLLAVPIRDYLVHIVGDTVKKLGVEVEVKLAAMTQEERERFFKMAQEVWRGWRRRGFRQ